jgi:hypothetical protein
VELNRATAAYEHAIVSPLFLLNGGAVVAFLTLLGTATKKESTLSMDIAVATLAVFVWALSLLVAAAGVRAGYESQQRFTRAVTARRQLMEHALPSRSALTEVLRPPPDKSAPAKLLDEARDRQREWLRRTQLSLVGFIAGAVVAAGSIVLGALAGGPQLGPVNVKDAVAWIAWISTGLIVAAVAISTFVKERRKASGGAGPKTILAEGDLTKSDHLVVELVDGQETPQVVRIHWPVKATVVLPAAYGDTAAEAKRVLANAEMELARLR